MLSWDFCSIYFGFQEIYQAGPELRPKPWVSVGVFQKLCLDLFDTVTVINQGLDAV